MGISFIRELENKIKYECSICYDSKILKYLIMDDKGNMSSICEECMDNMIICETTLLR